MTRLGLCVDILMSLVDLKSSEINSQYRRNNEQQIDGIWSMSKIVNLTIRDVTVSNEKLLDICNSSEILKKHDEIITIYMHILYSEYN